MTLPQALAIWIVVPLLVVLRGTVGYRMGIWYPDVTIPLLVGFAIAKFVR